MKYCTGKIWDGYELIVFKEKNAIVFHSASPFIAYELPNGEYDPDFIKNIEYRNETKI